MTKKRNEKNYGKDPCAIPPRFPAETRKRARVANRRSRGAYFAIVSSDKRFSFPVDIDWFALRQDIADHGETHRTSSAVNSREIIVH